MATADSMQRRYAASQQYAGANYDRAKGSMPSRFAEGVQRAFGVSPGPATMQRYTSGVQNATYRAGDPAYWWRRTIEGWQK